MENELYAMTFSKKSNVEEGGSSSSNVDPCATAVPLANKKPKAISYSATANNGIRTIPSAEAVQQPKDNNNDQSTNTNWRCDFCLVAVFDDYDVAVAHEKTCTVNVNGDDAKMFKKKAKKQGGEHETTMGEQHEPATTTTTSSQQIDTTSATTATDTTNDGQTVIQKGSYVTVKDRRLPPSSKNPTKMIYRSGGVARVTGIHRSSTFENNGGNCTYDVSYILGGYEKGVEECHVSPSSYNDKQQDDDVKEEQSVDQKSVTTCTKNKKPPKKLIVKPTATVALDSPPKWLPKECECIKEKEGQQKQHSPNSDPCSFEHSPTSPFATLPHGPAVVGIVQRGSIGTARTAAAVAAADTTAIAAGTIAIAATDSNNNGFNSKLDAATALACLRREGVPERVMQEEEVAELDRNLSSARVKNSEDAATHVPMEAFKKDATSLTSITTTSYVEVNNSLAEQLDERLSESSPVQNSLIASDDTVMDNIANSGIASEFNSCAFRTIGTVSKEQDQNNNVPMESSQGRSIQNVDTMKKSEDYDATIEAKSQSQQYDDNMLFTSKEIAPAKASEKVPIQSQGQAVVKAKSTSPKRSFLFVIFILLLPIALLIAWIPLHNRERVLTTLLLPTVTSITLLTMTILLFVVIFAYSIFEFTMIVTHEGPHHHISHGWLLELYIAARDALFSFRKEPGTAPEEEEVELATAATTDLPLPTLREFLSHPDGFHMGFAPAFFGFFAYFGALAALEEETNGRIVPTVTKQSQLLSDSLPAVVAAAPAKSQEEKEGDTSDDSTACGLNSTSGASAGAMAAVMLAAGIQPRDAAEFASTFTWGMVSDPPGWGGYVKGNNFEEAMRKFIGENAVRIIRGDDPRTSTSGSDSGSGDSDEGVSAGDSDESRARPFQLEEALVPVSVSGFDLLRMRGMNLSVGCMAKAARSSAGFPGLFQPVAWREENAGENGNSSDSDNNSMKWLPDSLLIDGGITDGLGLNGLGAFSCTKKKRVINMVVGDFGYQGPSGIKDLPPGVNASSLISIALVGTPVCGPWAMRNGPRAVESARLAMVAALDMPMERGTCDDHFVIRVDASKWLEE
mmetsp:Transcript_13102/g.28434  ORF Transcript_13102/g.28434 Transcript_13102/m.28434 type:complete len:1079 (+) Transcript_13102:290-3526(+)